MTPRARLGGILVAAVADGTGLLRFLEGQGIAEARSEIRFNGRLADECYDAADFLVRRGYVGVDLLWALLARAPDQEAALQALAAACRIPWDGAPPTVLFVPAAPLDTTALGNALIELRSIRGAWTEARVRDLPAARHRDLLRAVGEHPVAMLHIAGHGDSRTLLFHGDDDDSEPLTADAVLEVLALAGQRHREVELVVLNGCATAPMAEALATSSRPAIGVDGLLDDPAAAAFTNALHSRLATQPGAWRSLLQRAFDDAKAQAQRLGRAAYHLYP